VVMPMQWFFRRCVNSAILVKTATFFYPSFEVAKFPHLRDDSSRNTAETW
jgi:hypothetical protein